MSSISISAIDMFRLSRQVESSESIAKSKLVQEINDHVKRAAEQGLLATNFHVPIILGGCPAYNHGEVCEMLREHYQTGGFRAKLGAGGVLGLSWDLEGADAATQEMERNDTGVRFLFSREDDD